MRIGYISFEYPPDTAVGGIATYVYQASQLMKARGHQVEVFCASYERTVSEIWEGIPVHRIKSAEPLRFEFGKSILPVFLERHTAVRFDLIESPEYSADGLAIKQHCPELALVVKLHTPHYLIRKLSTHYDPVWKKAYYMLAHLLRGKLVRPYWLYEKKQDDPDYRIIAVADQIHTPSVSLGRIVAKKWKIGSQRILHVPYPFIPKPALLSIPAETSKGVVTYVGRLEIRKGVIALAEAIPLVLKRNPSIRFRLSGANTASPAPGVDMKTYLMQRLEAHKEKIEFIQVPADRVAEVYAGTDICVFPSIWENFPNVCLEAMSSARGIVASREGGMKDMLEEPPCGLLIDPMDAKALARSILYLLDHPAHRTELGRQARNKVLDTYNAEAIGRLMEEHYLQAVEQKKSSR